VGYIGGKGELDDEVDEVDEVDSVWIGVVVRWYVIEFG
jgi:hypothetical protein